MLPLMCPGLLDLYILCVYLTGPILWLYTHCCRVIRSNKRKTFFFSCIENDVLGHSRVTENLVQNLLSFISRGLSDSDFLLVELL